MQLELFTRLPTKSVTRPALLCIPGAWHNAACWLPFLAYFAQRGYRAAAVNLRGHGNSPGWGKLHRFGLREYSADITTAIAYLIKEWGQAPLLIGHSSGGWLVQKHLEQHSAPAGVLLASLPPTGVRQVRNPFAQKHPLRFFLALTGLAPRAMLGETAILREAFFAPTTPLTHVRQQMVHLQAESRRMLFGLGGRTTIDPARVQAPLLVLGGGADNFLPPTAVTATAQAYATQAIFIPNVGHAMMTDIRWEDVAHAILTWVEDELCGLG